MARPPNGEVRRYVRALFDVGTVAGLSDGQLLDRFASRGGELAELAFSALVERHGPMVLRVCRRVLADPHDAEDAFQAVFLVLARRAASIRSRESLASWLHGVALRVASAARAARDRRKAHEGRAAARRAVIVEDRRAGDELGRALQEEIGRMPERYRAAAVLCYLEGRTYDEAARLLGCPVGTIKSRLATAREKLRKGLNRRGLGPPAGILGSMLAAEAATAAMPRGLVEATVRSASWLATGRNATAGTVSAAVATLTEGVLKTMVLTKVRMTMALVLVVGIGVGTAGVGVRAQQSKGLGDRQGGGTAADPTSRAATQPSEEGNGKVSRSARGIRKPTNFPPGLALDGTGAIVREEEPDGTISLAYYIGDLVLPARPAPSRGVQPGIDERPQVDMTPVIELIASSVAPGTWKGYNNRGKTKPGEGGHDEPEMGLITPFYLSISLHIRHTAEVHDQLAERLRQLRRLPLIATAPGSESKAESPRLNTPPPSAPGSESGVEDRLREVERKLDRVLNALELSQRGTGDSRQLEPIPTTGRE